MVSLRFGQGPADIACATAWTSAPHTSELNLDRRHQLNALRIGRVYSFEELHLDDGGEAPPFGRVLRVGDSDWSAWLMITRVRGDFSAADSVFLSALAPHLSIAMSTFALIERQRQALATSENLLARLGVSWAQIDSEGKLIDDGVRPSAPGIERAIAAASSKKSARIRPQALSGREIATTQTSTPPQTTVLLRTPMVVQPRHAKMLEDLWMLSPNEARLAAAIANGQSLAEAAAALNLTEATARNYSKRIYAKTGVRGLAELTRLVLNSVALLT